VTLPLVKPALYAALLVSTLRAVEAFEVPALLGIPTGTWVFTSRIWQALDGFPADTARGSAYAMPLLAITVAGVFLYSRLARRASSYQVVRGGGLKPRPVPLGRWRWPLAAAAFVYLLLASVAPLLVLLYASLQPFYDSPSIAGLSHVTGSNYSALFHDGATIRAIGNSLVVALVTASAVTIVMTMVAWLVVRGRARGRWIVDALASLPLVIPGLVLGLAILLVYLRVPGPLYGSLWILVVAYFTRFMPYGMRYAAAALHQLSDEVEEAARISGATWGQTLRRIVAPLVAPALLAGWLYVVFLSMRELSASVLLFSPGHEVVTVRMLALYDSGGLTSVAALGILTTALLTALMAVTWRIGGRFAGWTR
jgi:iron(III) transport system permease protein